MHHYLPNFLIFLVLIQAFLANCCIEHERQALLKFKGSVNDPSNRLASWRGNECCNWAGIRCSNRTGRVFELNLRYSYEQNNSLSGEINPALHFLSELKHLDLSYNEFNGSKFPKFISSFKCLNYLNLSSTGLSGIIPPELSNLSKLQYLDLNHMPDTFVSNVQWLSQLTSLKYLAMEKINFLDSREWVPALNKLPLLQTLYLGGNNLTMIPASVNGLNFSSLKILSVSDNNFNTRIPDWIGKLIKLKTLQLENCFFVGPIPNQLDNLTSLETLELLGNNMQGPMPPLHNLKNLTELWISDVDIGEDIRDVMSKLANETSGKLEVLFLMNTNLTGNLTGWLSKLHALNTLWLYENNLNGTIPTEIGNNTSLENLNLVANSLTGELSETHLTGLSNLKYLALDYNNITITVGRNWVPPFQLEYIFLADCKLGHHFPSWLQNQSQMMYIDLRNTGIDDTVPNWFWDFQSLLYIALSHNHITGMLPMSLEHLTKLHTLILSNNWFESGIPSLPHSIMYVDISYNLLSGPIPHRVKVPNLSVFVFSNNLLHGTIEHLTCGLDKLEYLILGKNNFSGNLPHCWPTTLRVVNLAHNKLLGAIPSSIGNLNFSLEVLQINNNSLTGELPSTLQFCHNLIVLDVGENNISGQIPDWIGKSLKNLTILRLRSNMFFGKIPVQLMHLNNLQVLDCANNHISGSIPPNLEHLAAMASSTSVKKSSYQDFFNTSNENYYNISMLVVMKGLELEYTTTLSLLRSIDLSNNNLTGHIPLKITTLLALINLNLSNNHLHGSIPMQIGDMQLLESLDLRMNELSGSIPKNMANLNFLTTLNLSYNNLSGPIPTGNQLQSLDDPYIYIGNSYLCGTLWSRSCNNSETPSGYDTHNNDDWEKVLLYLFMVLGFVLGFWAIYGLLIFKPNSRYLLFRMIDNVFDGVYVFGAVYLARLVKADESSDRN